VRHHPKRLPVIFSQEIEITGADTLTVRSSAAVQEVTFTKLGDPADPYLYPAWPPESGIEGGLKILRGICSVYFAPASYPWQWVAEKLQDHPAALEILRCTGYVDAFGVASSPVTKVGAVAAALYTLSSQGNG